MKLIYLNAGSFSQVRIKEKREAHIIFPKLINEERLP